MDEVILFPSPNWFQVSGLAVSYDGWVVYGGPSKSLCVLKPLPADYNGALEGPQRYTAHVLNRAHPDKIVSVDISPEWPVNKLVLTGSAHGSVKQWTMECEEETFKIKSNLSHNVHAQEHESVLTVAYVTDVYAVTLGVLGNLVRWDLYSNVVKTYKNLLKAFKPTCMACSPHVPLNVAVGTKQGVLFVLDLSSNGTILYKVRSQDDEIMNLSWCPQYEVQIEKLLDDDALRTGASQKPNSKKFSASDRMAKIRQNIEPEEKNVSGVVKDLPEDSFDDLEVVQEDDMFDIYKDHEADEFGHKKYEPEDILVKVKESKEEIDYLTECLKLKDAILNKKTEPEPTIESLVEKFDKTDLNSEASINREGSSDIEGTPKEGLSTKDEPFNKEDASSIEPSNEQSPSKDETSTVEVPLDKEETSKNELSNRKVDSNKFNSVSSMHMHKHVLATIGKHGAVRIWSKTGKLIGSCGLSSGKAPQGRNKNTSWATLAWCRPDTLLIVDAKSHLLKCNPLLLDGKNKLETHLVHAEHKRGLHCVATNASRRHPPASPAVWTASQDRLLVCHLLEEGTTTVYNTCGGFIYNVQTCPYDVTRVAASVGDGAVRVWITDESETEGKLTAGRVHTYWQNVQGKVLTVDWHPTKENLLAYGTAEARVGIVEARGAERAGRALAPALAGGVYSLCWAGPGCTRRRAAPSSRTTPTRPTNRRPRSRWWWRARRGRRARCARRPAGSPSSEAGGVAVLSEPGHELLAVCYPFSKIIHTLAWHPEQTSLSSEDSKHKNLLAVCSQDKSNSLVILELVDTEDGGKKLQTFKTLCGHSSTLLQVAWSPHHEARLLSTSQDGTVQVWDALTGSCQSVFAGHGTTALTAVWCPWPALPDTIISGGADCCLRLWNTKDHPSPSDDTKPVMPKKDKKRKNKKQVAEGVVCDDETTAAVLDVRSKGSNKFLLPMIARQMGSNRIPAAKKLLFNYMNKKFENQVAESDQYHDIDFIKMFGTNNELNEVFDMEMERHLEFGNTEAWIVLSVFRGHIDVMMQYASEKNLICPYLLSIAPSVSSKYWKDASRLYLAQIDRLVANGEEEKLAVNRTYGGPVYRKAVTQLSLQDVKGAVATLCEARLYKEAYLLCRIRYIDTIAEEVLDAWAKNCIHSGVPDMAAICYIALGNLLEAAQVLGKCNDQESLSLAADLAKAAGQTILSDNIMERKAQIKEKIPETVEEVLAQLPTRMELLLKEKQEVKDEDMKENVELNSQCEDAILLKEKQGEVTDQHIKEGEEPSGQCEVAIEN
ncbi:LOW QUALITY PROTEIN: gem-associated protein 5-like [Choristoneura fumiferana]|uniref:LOW QUALITY PROTEIN: gem-associated protein 5-like n=1 Tax=Choristoneura fumiferana TaxID=7141 RepID=UPI003D15A476